MASESHHCAPHQSPEIDIFTRRADEQETRREMLTSRRFVPKQQSRFVYDEACHRIDKLPTLGDVLDVLSQAIDGALSHFLLSSSKLTPRVQRCIFSFLLVGSIVTSQSATFSLYLRHLPWQGVPLNGRSNSLTLNFLASWSMQSDCPGRIRELYVSQSQGSFFPVVLTASLP